MVALSPLKIYSLNPFLYPCSFPFFLSYSAQYEQSNETTTMQSNEGTSASGYEIFSGRSSPQGSSQDPDYTPRTNSATAYLADGLRNGVQLAIEAVGCVTQRYEDGRTTAMQITERLRRALCIDCGDCLETLDWEDDKIDTLRKYYEEEGLLTGDGPRCCRICSTLIRRSTRTASFSLVFVPGTPFPIPLITKGKKTTSR